MATGDLLTLAEYKTATGLTGTQDDAKLGQAITFASEAIRDYVEVAIGLPAVAGTREYDYFGNGFLEIDACTLVTAVRSDGIALTTAAWRAAPRRGPVFTWLELMIPHRGRSAEMGFMRNEDRMPPIGLAPIVIAIDATYGMPTIPPGVKQAAVWAVSSFMSNPQAYLSESVAGYSRTVENPAREAIPNRAKDLLAPWMRHDA